VLALDLHLVLGELRLICRPLVRQAHLALSLTGRVAGKCLSIGGPAGGKGLGVRTFPARGKRTQPGWRLGKEVLLTWLRYQYYQLRCGPEL
jgi:hypothetical protein